MEFFFCKNACDGIGGVLKRAAYKYSLQRIISNHILTPKALFEFAEKEVKGIRYIYTSEVEIIKSKNILQTRFAATSTIKGTQSFHKIVPIKPNQFFAYVTSQTNEKQLCQFTTVDSDENTMLSPGFYVACIYDNSFWIGIIKEYSEENDDFSISFLHRDECTVTKFFFPEKEDSCWVQASNILAKLNLPDIVPGIKITHSFSTKEINGAMMRFNATKK